MPSRNHEISLISACVLLEFHGAPLFAAVPSIPYLCPQERKGNLMDLLAFFTEFMNLMDLMNSIALQSDALAKGIRCTGKGDPMHWQRGSDAQAKGEPKGIIDFLWFRWGVQGPFFSDAARCARRGGCGIMHRGARAPGGGRRRIHTRKYFALHLIYYTLSLLIRR